MMQFSCNSVFNEDNANNDKRRLLKAFHAFKSDPSEYNFNRIAKAVKTAGDAVYIENAVNDFTQSLIGRDRYSNYIHSFSELQK